MMLALSDRALIEISGDEAASFLQNLITTDMDKVLQGGCHAGALLTPQGKIQFEFLVSSTDGVLRLETGKEQIDALLKRLIMYRLRLPLTIEKRTDLHVYAHRDAGFGLRDHRFQSDIYRSYKTHAPADEENDWLKQIMIEEGIAQIGVDYVLNDVFPHDINFDQIGGMSFSKGCYVGQEVISRMHHKGGVRKRLMVVKADRDLGDEALMLTVDGKPIGAVGNRVQNKALAICRIDKASKAIMDESPIMLGDDPVSLEKPQNASFVFPLEGSAT